MYTTNVGGEITTYDSIYEQDAYRIAIQVLKEMQDETVISPELFPRGFSEIYNLLISNVMTTAQCIKMTKED